MKNTKIGTSKKGQAALDFLMTYGWAILLALTIFSALFFFDVINFKDKLPEQSMFPPPFNSLDFSIDSNGVISIKLKNNLDVPLEILTTGFSGTKECSTITGVTSNTSIVSSLGEFVVNFTCPDAAGMRFHSYLTFSYNNTQSGNVHTNTGYVTING